MKRQAAQPVPVLVLTPEQACEALQIGRDQLDKWLHREGFPVVKDGRIVRIPVEPLRAWLAEQAALTNSAPADPVRLARLPMRSSLLRGTSI